MQPRLREALKYMIYGKENVFDADRMVDMLEVGGMGCILSLAHTVVSGQSQHVDGSM